LPRLSGDFKAFECYDSEIAVLEPATGEALGAVGDHYGVRLSERLEPRGQVRCFPQRSTLPGGTDVSQLANHDQAGRDADARAQLLLPYAEFSDIRHDRQGGAHRALGIVFVRLGITEIDQGTVAHVSGDEAVKAPNRVGHAAVVRADDIAQVLGIKSR
jgi:hypothetical protein